MGEARRRRTGPPATPVPPAGMSTEGERQPPAESAAHEGGDSPRAERDPVLRRALLWLGIWGVVIVLGLSLIGMIAGK